MSTSTSAVATPVRNLSLSSSSRSSGRSLDLVGPFPCSELQNSLAGKDLDGEVWDKSSSCQQIFEVFSVVWKQCRCAVRGQLFEQPSRSSLHASYPLIAWALLVGVGIFSFARYGKDFYTSKYEGSVKTPQLKSSTDYSIFDNYYIPEITSVLLLRSCKVSCLEKSSFFVFCR